MIIITHKLNEVAYVADKITVVRDGSTIETIYNTNRDIDEDRIIKGLFFFEEGQLSDSSVYIANDKSADIVAVFIGDDTAAIREKVTQYLASAKEQMQNYYPDEVFKIDNAIIQEAGNQVALIVTSDIENARKVAESVIR